MPTRPRTRPGRSPPPPASSGNGARSTSPVARSCTSTPASPAWWARSCSAGGNVGIPGAFAIGLGVGVVCLWGVTGLKRLIKADDSLDVFGVHAIGGIFGALMTGVFNAPSLGGPGSTLDWVKGTSGYPGIWKQFIIQLQAVCLVFVWTAVVAFIAFYIVKRLVGVRVPEEA